MSLDWRGIAVVSLVLYGPWAMALLVALVRGYDVALTITKRRGGHSRRD